MREIKMKCSSCNQNITMSVDEGTKTIFCPFCAAKNEVPEVVKTTNYTNSVNYVQNYQNKNRVRKSDISSWWGMIFLISGFGTICKGGPTMNLIGWPLLLFYVHSNASQSGIHEDEDTLLTVGGCIIWLVNLWLVLTI